MENSFSCKACLDSGIVKQVVGQCVVSYRCEECKGLKKNPTLTKSDEEPGGIFGSRHSVGSLFDEFPSEQEAVNLVESYNQHVVSVMATCRDVIPEMTESAEHH